MKLVDDVKNYLLNRHGGLQKLHLGWISNVINFIVTAKEELSKMTDKYMIRRMKTLIADQLPKKGTLLRHSS